MFLQTHGKSGLSPYSTRIGWFTPHSSSSSTTIADAVLLASTTLLVPCGLATLNPCGRHHTSWSRCASDLRAAAGAAAGTEAWLGCECVCAVNPTRRPISAPLSRSSRTLRSTRARRERVATSMRLLAAGATAQSVSTGARGLHPTSTPYAAYLVPPYRVHVHLKTGASTRSCVYAERRRRTRPAGYGGCLLPAECLGPGAMCVPPLYNLGGGNVKPSTVALHFRYHARRRRARVHLHRGGAKLTFRR